jgi:hypothetical protein
MTLSQTRLGQPWALGGAAAVVMAGRRRRSVEGGPWTGTLMSDDLRR